MMLFGDGHEILDAVLINLDYAATTGGENSSAEGYRLLFCACLLLPDFIDPFLMSATMEDGA